MKILCGARVVSGRCELFRSGRTFTGDLKKELAGVLPENRVDWGDCRRGGEPVKLAILAAAAALVDLPVRCEREQTGVLGWNGAGCRTENVRFWRDCREHDGWGRGALFVGTLNSIPVCEAAIALGLHGASGYLAGADWRRAAADFMRCHALASLLMMEVGSGRADALWLAPEEGVEEAEFDSVFGACCDGLLRRNKGLLSGRDWAAGSGEKGGGRFS